MTDESLPFTSYSILIENHRASMKETLAAESESSRPSGIRTALFVLVVFVFYVLSTGPVWWLHKHGFISRPAFEIIYLPIGYLIDHSPGDILFRYISWWSPIIGL